MNERSALRRGRYLHNTQQTQEAKSHALNEIRICYRSKQTATVNHRSHGRRKRQQPKQQIPPAPPTPLPSALYFYSFIFFIQDAEKLHAQTP